jgi:hypothetical protein
MLNSMRNNLAKAKAPNGHPLLSYKLLEAIQWTEDTSFIRTNVTVAQTPKEVEFLWEATLTNAVALKGYLIPLSYNGVCLQDDRYWEFQQFLSGSDYDPVLYITLLPRDWIPNGKKVYVPAPPKPAFVKPPKAALLKEKAKPAVERKKR